MRAARIDPLTDVRNRLGLTDDLEAAKARVERYGHRYCVAICDVDDFKRYNDRYGHLAGDEVLRGVAGTMRKHLRQGDTLYRYGGEEFLVLLPEQHEGDACAALERVRLEVERLGIPIFDSPRDKEGSPGAPRLLTISVGVAALGAGEAVDAWIARADRALFQAKRAGKNRVELAVAPSNASHRSSPDVAS
jgi:diguanylate cyclase (GGDEF)-like protein